MLIQPLRHYHKICQVAQCEASQGEVETKSLKIYHKTAGPDSCNC